MASHKILMYSFKGGAGRTVSLANVAFVLAKEMNRRVLCIDMDIESAGASVLFGLQDKVLKGECWTLQDVLSGRFVPPGQDTESRSGGAQSIVLGRGDFATQIWPRLRQRVVESSASGGYLDFLPARTILTPSDDPRPYSRESKDKFAQLLIKIDALPDSPEYIIIDSASGQQEAALLGLDNCTTLVVFIRWSRQFVFGTINFLRQYICQRRFCPRISPVFLVPTAVPRVPPEGDLNRQLEVRRKDLDDTVRLLNNRATRDFRAPRNWIRRADPIHECIGLKWDDRVFLREEPFPNDQDTQGVLTNYRGLAQSIVQALEEKRGETSHG